MSAVNPLPSEMAPPRSMQEPSMEEILASIRRIIADDHTLPVPPRDIRSAPAAVADVPAPPVTASAPELAQAPRPTVQNAALVQGEEPARNVAAPSTTRPAAPVGNPSVPPQAGADVMPTPPFKAHGQIAAPQFAMPHGPAGDTPVETDNASAPPSETHDAKDRRADFQPEPEPLQEASAEPPPEDHDIEEEESFEDVPLSRPPVAAEPVINNLFSRTTDSSVTAAFNMLAASRLADNSDELMTLAREMIRPLLRTWLDDNLPTMVERMVRAEIERVARGGR